MEVPAHPSPTPPPMHPALAVVIAIVAVVISSAVQAFIATPFVGALTRLRTNYNPRRIVLESEDVEVEEFSGPRLKGVFATLGRTAKLEGWWGVYKGAYATLAANVFAMMPVLAILGIALKEGSERPQIKAWAMTAISKPKLAPTAQQIINEVSGGMIGIILGLPAVVLWTRAFVTPYRLPFAPRSVRALLSKTERERFWRLWLAPGLLIGLFLSWFSQWAITAIAFPLPAVYPNGKHGKHDDYSFNIEKKYIPFIVVMVLSTIWITPLSVATTKIAASPDYSTPGYVNSGIEAAVENAIAADNDTNPERLAEAEQHTFLESHYVRASRTDEDTITIRPPPRYTGLFDAFASIKGEEGLPALYRGWIWTALGNALTAVGAVHLHKLALRM